MMVYASNQPAHFDAAVMDRIDEMVEFGLPEPHKRKKMLLLYIQKYLLEPPDPGTRRVRVKGVDNKQIKRAVWETHGFSGRAISKLAIAWQAAAYGTDGAVLDRDAFFATLDDHKRSMRQKDDWLRGATERAEHLTTDLSLHVYRY